MLYSSSYAHEYQTCSNRISNNLHQIRTTEKKISELESLLQAKLAGLDLDQLNGDPFEDAVPELQTTEVNLQETENSRKVGEEEKIILDRDQEQEQCLTTHFKGYQADGQQWWLNRMINVTDVGPLQVQCMNEYPYDTPWIMILKRFNGHVNFNRNWEVLKNGIGSLEGEFFIGLQKLHLLTVSRRYVLRVYLRDSKSQYNIFYNNFVVGSEDEGYALRSLGKHWGNADDYLRTNRYSFATYDRDHKLSCARQYGPWWQRGHNTCTFTNLFVQNPFWGSINPTISIYMMIRPICPYS